MSNRDLFLDNLKYDYKKYNEKYEQVLHEIESLEESPIRKFTAQVVDSSNWQQSSLEDDYEREKERKQIEQATLNSRANIAELKRWAEHGLFQRKLQFSNNQNFYITTACVKLDYSFGNDFILAYWGDDTHRISTLMQFEIGDISPKNGELIFVGDFIAKKDDLTNIRYKNEYGKQEFKSAKEIISGEQQEVIFEQMKMDTQNFFRLKFELANIGDQSKALYDTKSAIIDGAAGTGKSTIALQKLKYLNLNFGISQDECLVIVKNEQAIYHFKTLLQDRELELDAIKIFTVEECFKNFNLDGSITLDKLLTAKSNALIIDKELDDFVGNPNQETLQSHYQALAKFIGIQRFKDILSVMIHEIAQDSDRQNKILELDKQIVEINDSMIDDLIDDEKKLELIERLKNAKNRRNQLSGQNYIKASEMLDTSIEKISINVLSDIVDFEYGKKDIEALKAIFLTKKHTNFLSEQDKSKKQLDGIFEQLESMGSLQALIEKQNKIEEIIKEIEESINFDPNKLSEQEKKYYNTKKSINEEIKKYNDLLDKKESLKEKIVRTFEITPIEKREYKKVLFSIYKTHQFISDTFLNSSSEEERYLTLQYLFSDDRPYNTIVVDEAQDYSLVELELLRLQTQKIILTGDLLQNIDDERFFRKWEDILSFEEVYCYEDDLGEKKTNIFHLKHNFRQTYQLANASFNYRQLMLNHESELEDIQAEYYTSEKEFNGKPYSLPLVKFLDKMHFKTYFEEKFEFVKNTYSSKIPIAIIYKSLEEKHFYETLLRDYHLSNSTQTSLSNEIPDALLVSLFEVKGKEFPIVVCNIDTLENSEIYLIMTRAQFELECITCSKNITNQFLSILEQHHWLNYDGLHNNDIKNDEIVSIQENKNTQVEEIHRLEINEDKRQDIEKTLIDKIDDHKKSVDQTKEEIVPSFIIDEEKYQAVFQSKLIHQKNFKPKRKVVFVFKTDDAIVDELNNEVKMFLYEAYKGHCQLCGFTFKKIRDQRNSFEKFNWNDKRIVKVEKKFISSADSLCLCRNCVANIKFGDFEPEFIEKIKAIENFESKDFEQIISLLQSTAENNIPKIFENHVLFDDIVPLEIKLNKEAKRLYFTREHLLQFIVFLQMEKGYI